MAKFFFYAILLVLIHCYSTMCQEEGDDDVSVGNGTDSNSDSSNGGSGVGSSNFCLLEINTKGCKEDSECANFNGYAAVCGSQSMCECADTKSCNTTAVNTTQSGLAPQFGQCSEDVLCVDGYGVGSKDKQGARVCAEKIDCVPELNDTSGRETTSFCHTCSSCLEQTNTKSGTRFDCSVVCSRERMEKEEERLKKEKEKKEQDGDESGDESGDDDNQEGGKGGESGEGAACSLTPLVNGIISVFLFSMFL